MNHYNHLFIYTNGSKYEGEVGCAAILGKIYRKKLMGIASIYSSEINLAFDIRTNEHDKFFCAYNYKNKNFNPLITQILDTIQHISKVKKINSVGYQVT